MGFFQAAHSWPCGTLQLLLVVQWGMTVITIGMRNMTHEIKRHGQVSSSVLQSVLEHELFTTRGTYMNHITTFLIGKVVSLKWMINSMFLFFFPIRQKSRIV